MVDREKVMRGLKACNRQSYNGSDCQNCPYYDDEDTAELPFGICNIQDMFDDALALLEEQETKKTAKEWKIAGVFDDFSQCPECGNMWPIFSTIEWAYCPVCGCRILSVPKLPKGEDDG